LATQIKKILVPDIGTTGEVDVIEVLVKPGEKIHIDSPLVTLESEKASMEIPSQEEGTIESLHVKVGDKIKMGSLILTLKEDSAHQAAETKQEQPSEKSLEKTSEIKSEVKTESPKLSPSSSSSSKLYTSPIVRRLANELDVDLSAITGTGIKNRIQKEDLLKFIKSKFKSGSGASSGTGLPLPPMVDFAQFGEIEVKALNKIKKLTAINLHRNWVLVPHVTQFDEADITELEAFRKAQAEKNLKLTPLVFIMKAIVAALKKFPQFNSSLDPSGESLILKKYFHIGVAVDTPEGLVVPVVRDVDKKSISELAKELSGISEKARNKQLLPKDMQGSCFTISSLGGIGGTAFTPIVNMPDVAILGVSKSHVKPVYQNNEFVPRLMLPLSLSYDHRVIDGAEACRFIVQLSHYLSDVKLLLI
jgi:pyruvate dehydrogenase E2 component (dihydrolipoamide acetyltransferase)